MDIDFSQLNLQYLILVRDLARRSPELAVAILGLPTELVKRLATLTAERLSVLARIKSPLLTLRHAKAIWWSRLFVALQDPRPDEMDVLLEQAHLNLVVPS